ncbi:thiamine pyrophosphate-binding protein [Paraburkholderia phenazinium]|uniref:thiamine pyrophosphate-binding protein n=1 Tax=Paraburkholderia phenazinium TaxID=60549 RepID=UPI0025B78209|nr:thiamine pyrophosphate-binding protein [Paraburkholderia phenazinium]
MGAQADAPSSDCSRERGGKRAKTAAEYMVGALAKAGIKRIFGVLGDSLSGFTDALRRAGSIEWGHVRHGESAAFAAGAEARLVRSTSRVCRPRRRPDRYARTRYLCGRLAISANRRDRS